MQGLWHNGLMQLHCRDACFHSQEATQQFEREALQIGHDLHWEAQGFCCAG
jgi:hypothetical protein